MAEKDASTDAATGEDKDNKDKGHGAAAAVGGAYPVYSSRPCTDYRFMHGRMAHEASNDGVRTS